MAKIYEVQSLDIGGRLFAISAQLDTETGNILAQVSVDGVPGAAGEESIDAKIQRAAALPAPYNGPLVQALEGVKSTLQAQNTALQPENVGTDPGAPENTNTEQQNKEYAASGSADDDKNPQTTPEVTPYTQSTTSQTNSTPGEISSNNAGTTVAGKSGTQANPQAQEKPGNRLFNPLGYLSSYNYQITLYMITPDAYDAFIQGGRKNINAIQNPGNTNAAASLANSQAGAFIIAQSGGVNNSFDRRAPGFDVDFYIDELKFTTITNSKSQSASAFQTNISFNIYEPYGFSFITKLREANQALQKYTSTVKNFKNVVNALRQFFVLGIRFYGYDRAGNLVKGNETINGQPLDPTSNGQSLFEKYFDIEITDFKFKIDGKATTYYVKAAQKSARTAFGIKRGRLDNGVTVVASNVTEALSDSSPNGLLAKLNDTQQKLLAAKNIEIPNVYKVRWVTGTEDIQKANLVTQADIDKAKKPMAPVASITQVNDATAAKASPDLTKQTIAFKNDTSIIQAIDQIIAQSSFLTDALKAVAKANEPPDPNNPEKYKENLDSPKYISWYNLSSEVKCLGFDTVVGDWAYEITYVIQPYITPIVVSPYANPGGKYYGPHKRYDYWYTGQNREILSYEQQMNTGYFTVTVAGLDVKAQQGQGGATQVPTVPNKRNDESRIGSNDQGLEAQNSYRTSLYDPGAYAKSKITILGDPDFLMDTSPTAANAVYSQFYKGDGLTINPNGGQVFVEIDFKEAVDYQHSKGYLNLNDSILFWPYPPEIAKIVKGVSFQVLQVNSDFSKGKFTQTLDLFINQFSDTKKTSNTIDSGRPDFIGESYAVPGTVPDLVGESYAVPGTIPQNTNTGLKPDPAVQASSNETAIQSSLESSNQSVPSNDPNFNPTLTPVTSPARIVTNNAAENTGAVQTGSGGNNPSPSIVNDDDAVSSNPTSPGLSGSSYDGGRD